MRPAFSAIANSAASDYLIRLANIILSE